MRSSDWSSDVCSSDLFWRRFFLNTRILSPRVCSTTSPATQTPSTKGEPDLAPAPSPNIRTDSKATTSPASPSSFSTTITSSLATLYCLPPVLITANMVRVRPVLRLFKSFRRVSPPPGRPPIRSEEHTSELQSLMRTQYAVFCLKKQTNTMKE